MEAPDLCRRKMDMVSALSHRLKFLEQQRPECQSHIVWCNADDDFKKIVAGAQAEHPDKRIVAIGWKASQDC